MQLKRKKRLFIIVFLLCGISSATALTLYALQQNINLYYTPSQLNNNNKLTSHPFRLGGLVKKGSIKRSIESLEVKFVLTDTKKDITIDYKGVLPDLFREGQGIVADGQLDEQGTFVAYQILAKHSSDYKPPNAAG